MPSTSSTPVFDELRRRGELPPRPLRPRHSPAPGARPWAAMRAVTICTPTSSAFLRQPGALTLAGAAIRAVRRPHRPQGRTDWGLGLYQ